MWRQGDLLIVRAGGVPKGAVKLGSRVLTEGEATGHLHELDRGEVYMEKDIMYFKVTEGTTTLAHPEHKPLTFEPGIYKAIRQREYEPKGWRRVND
jgi:hypothetical protein